MAPRPQPPDARAILRSPGRVVTPEEIEYSRRVIAQHPAWGRQALALHLCQRWDWRRPDGTLNHRACRHLLQRLAAQGILTLPPPTRTPGRRRRPLPAPPAGPGRPAELHPPDLDLAALSVRPVRGEERVRWRQLLAEHHYLGFRNTVGEALGYVATLGGHWVALLAWAAAAFKCRPRDAWIGWDEALKARRLHLVANNVRFLILPGMHRKNLASKVLALTLRRLSADWQARYGHPLLLAETFVDGARFAGTCYRAAGWRLLGQTRGFGRRRGGYFAHGTPKLIFVRPLHPAAATLLAAPFPPPLRPIRKEEHPMLDVNRLPLEGQDGLLELLRTVTDPRKPRGVRHSVVSIVALATCACLAGARSFEAIAQWAASLSRDALRRLGGRRRTPPSEPTFRRVLQRLDVEALDRQIGQWLARQQPLAGQGLAVDGKTLRGGHDGEHKAPHLLSAVLHQDGLVLAQRQVGEKTNEIPNLPPLLAGLNIAGAVVTADAMHTQTETARYLVADKGADYVFTVKDNQPTLKQDIQALGLEAVPPQHTDTDKGHGRIETRSIWTSTELVGYLEFPYAAQVFRVERHTTDLAGQDPRTEVAYGITSLTPAEADPARLLALNRAHWAIENKVHWVRDMTFDEDRCRARKGAGAHVLASLRNVAISLLRLAGAANIARALRDCSFRPHTPLRLIGVALA